MKIILLGPAYPYRGGPATFNDRLAKQFSDEGHDIEVITFVLQYPGLLFPGKTQYNDGPAPEGVRIKRLVNSVNPFNWISTGRKIKKIKPDLLLVRYWLPFMAPCFGTIARIVRSNRHTKILCIFDNVIPHEKRPGDKILTRFFASSIDGAVVMSRMVGNDLRLFRQSIPVKLSPHPLFDAYGEPVSREEAAASLGMDPQDSFLLFFGFIRAYKGLDLLIKAFSDKRLRKKGLKLIIAGEFYEDDTPYRDLVRQYELDGEIIFFDRFIRDEEVPVFFSLADLVVQPYRSATQSGVTQIAFHYDRPMLVTDVGGLSEIVRDGQCGYVVSPEPAGIADAILDYFDNNRKPVFEEGVRKAKDEFAWDKMTAAILEALKDSLKENV
jgi:D-inositol-3-phosphate glycosyltransferase